MHEMKEAPGQRGGVIGADYDMLRIDISRGELLVHATGGLLVLETMIGAGADTLQAN
jgi:hypothetical protein